MLAYACANCTGFVYCSTTLSNSSTPIGRDPSCASSLPRRVRPKTDICRTRRGDVQPITWGLLAPLSMQLLFTCCTSALLAPCSSGATHLHAHAPGASYHTLASSAKHATLAATSGHAGATPTKAPARDLNCPPPLQVTSNATQEAPDAVVVAGAHVREKKLCTSMFRDGCCISAARSVARSDANATSVVPASLRLLTTNTALPGTSIVTRPMSYYRCLNASSTSCKNVPVSGAWIRTS